MSTPVYRVKPREEGMFLNQLKNQIRAVTRLLDTTQQKFESSDGAVKSVKHEVTILLSELTVHGLLPEQIKHETGAVARTEEETIVEMTYVGKYTDTKLWMVSVGKETLATLKRERRLLRDEPGDIPLSFDEAISLLERRERIEKTPEELKTDRARYQTALKNIEREPDAYVAPDIARNWYQQQIERVTQQLQMQAVQVEEAHA